MNLAPASQALFELDILLALSRVQLALYALMAVNAVLWGLTMFGLVLLSRRVGTEKVRGGVRDLSGPESSLRHVSGRYAVLVDFLKIADYKARVRDSVSVAVWMHPDSWRRLVREIEDLIHERGTP